MTKQIDRREFIKLLALTAGSGLLVHFRNFQGPAQASTSTPGYKAYLPVITTPLTSWPMVAANPQRTSWTSEEVRGNLSPVWVRPIEPYINYKIQIIAGYGKLFISTAGGLYALNADNGNVDWVYPTELPLGNSPTIAGGIVYVGGYDRKIHALNVFSGKLIPTWNFVEAEAGFETNPLVINQTVFAGNRDGYFYALDAKTGALIWRYETGGPILHSAAYKDGVLYFASNDSHAYALKAFPDNPNNGQLVWKSTKLPGAGFHSYWPVIYTDEATDIDYVVFSGSQNIHSAPDLITYDRDALFPNNLTDPWGTLIGPTGKVAGEWAPGTTTIDVSKITNYLEQYPSRRVVFVIKAATGEEYTFDSNGNNQKEYAPFTFAGVTHSGNKYPPSVGPDGVLYQFANYMSAPWITRGQVAGWKFGTHFISRVADNDSAVDEPMAFSMGGNLVYWSLCCDRGAGAFDLSIPYGQPNRKWSYFNYNLAKIIPQYQPKYYGNDMNGWGLYGGVNGIYGKHGTQNPPIPFGGKIYMQKGNSIIAFGPSRNPVVTLPMASKLAPTISSNPLSKTQIQAKLEEEIKKIVSNPSTFLRPGYHGTGFYIYFDRIDGDRLFDYFHNPADTISTLAQARPYLSSSTRQQTDTYLQQFFDRFPPYNVVYVGWKDGLPREAFDIPPEVASYYTTGPLTTSESGTWWKSFPPDSFYGAWKYAEVFTSEAKSLYDLMKAKLETPPSDSYLLSKPYIHNAYIAGYLGFLELEHLAGNPISTNKKQILDHLKTLRAEQFTKDSPYVTLDTTDGRTSIDYNRVLNISRNFMFLVPELGDYLNQNALSKVQQAVLEYTRVAPYWFVTKFDVTSGEGVLQHLYDYFAIFQAKAYILKESSQELSKYLDVPAFERGDLFYIQNLIAALHAA